MAVSGHVVQNCCSAWNKIVTTLYLETNVLYVKLVNPQDEKYQSLLCPLFRSSFNKF